MFKLLREIRKLLKEIRDELRKSNEPVRFIEEQEVNKSDFRKITKKGILYKDKNYTFDGWEKYIGEVVNFEVFENSLVLTIEGQLFYATSQEELESLKEASEKAEKSWEKLKKDFDDLLQKTKKG